MECNPVLGLHNYKARSMKTPSALNNRSAKAQQSFRIVECSGRPGLRAVRRTLCEINQAKMNYKRARKEIIRSIWNSNQSQ